MSVTIITKFTENAGTEPTTLAKGELAADVKPSNAKLYIGDDVGGVSVLCQQPYISNSAAPPVVGQPKRGASWWQEDLKQMMFTVDGLVWEKAGYSVLGGDIGGNVKIEFDGHNYFETSQDVAGDASDIKGILMQGKLKIATDLHVVGKVNIGGDLVASSNVSVTGTVAAGADVQVGGRCFRQNQGAYTNYSDAGFQFGRITVSTGPPAGSGMVAGDIHYQVQP